MPSPSLTCTVLSSLVTETTLFQHSALLLDFMPTFSYMTLSRLHEPNNTRVNSSSTEAEKQHWEIFGYPEMNESKKISLSDWHNAHALTADWATEWENCIGQEKETLVVVFFPPLYCPAGSSESFWKKVAIWKAHQGQIMTNGRCHVPCQNAEISLLCSFSPPHPFSQSLTLLFLVPSSFLHLSSMTKAVAQILALASV